MKKSFLIAAIVPLLAACGGLTPSGPQGGRGGKADGYVFDPTLSCASSCGALASSGPGYCYCDEECADWGDCCADKDSVCDSCGPTIDRSCTGLGSCPTGWVWDGPNCECACDAPDPQSCLALDADFQTAVAQAGACTYDAQCQNLIGGSLKCGTPRAAINPANAAQVEAVRQSWTDAGCNQIHWDCPMLMPLPPWYETRGVCEQGSCQVKQIDTQACEAQATSYETAVAQAGACTADADCGNFVAGALKCGHPTRAINPASVAQINALQQGWTDSGCGLLDWNCPLMSAANSMMPPWIEARPVCKPYGCDIDYVDTRTE